MGRDSALIRRLLGGHSLLPAHMAGRSDWPGKAPEPGDRQLWDPGRGHSGGAPQLAILYPEAAGGGREPPCLSASPLKPSRTTPEHLPTVSSFLQTPGLPPNPVTHFRF